MPCEQLAEVADVADAVDVVVVEQELLDHPVARAQRRDERLGVADAREGDDLTLRMQRLGVGLAGVEGLRLETLDAREVDLLVGDLDEHLAQDAPLDGSHVFGAFRHHEVVGAVQLLGQVAQRAHGQHTIVLHGACGVDHHHVDFGLDVAVLEAVVHDDQIHLGVLGEDAADAVGPLLADDDHRVGELELDLQRFVAHVAVVRVGPDLQVAFGAPAVAAREQGHVVHLRHVADNHFGHRGLARSAYGDVADADDRNVEPFAAEHTPVEETVTKRHRRLVQGSRRSKQNV